MKDFIVSLDSFSFERKSDTGKYYVSGYASLPTVDAEQEKIISKGIDFKDFINHGYFNWDHSHRPEDIVALPIEKGCFIDKKGFFVSGKMLETPTAKNLITLYNTLKQSEKNLLGMSIEGKVLKRNDRDPRIIEKAQVKWIAITPRAINRDTIKSFQIFAKSFVAPVPDMENIAPVVKQDIEKEPKITTYTVLYKDKKIQVPDLYTFAVVELTLNNGMNIADAELLAKKFESLISEIDVSKAEKIDYKKVMEAGIKIYKRVFGDKFDMDKFTDTVSRALEMAKDTEDAIGILQRFLQAK